MNQEEEGLIESPDEESSIIRAQNSCKDDQKHPKVNGHTIMDANEASNAASDHNPLINIEDSDIPQIPTSNLFIIRKIWVWIVSVFITFVICLSVFPSITAIVESTGKGKVRAILRFLRFRQRIFIISFIYACSIFNYYFHRETNGTIFISRQLDVS